jgi:hypothetical protein
MSSSPEATERLWRRRALGAPALPYASALIGIDQHELRSAVALSLAVSDEARELLDGMELRVRTLTTGVHTDAERCVNSVRGPVLWAETITARANALGNDDVFVCQTSTRSFDTVENRVLVDALETLAGAARALDTGAGSKLDPDSVARVREVAAEAASWRQHPRLAGVRGGRLRPRDRARLRGGHRLARLAAVMAVRERARDPFVAEDVGGLADDATRRYHDFAEGLVAEMQRRHLVPGVLSCSDGGLWSGALAWRHPAVDGGAVAGLSYRGIPLLPPPAVLEGAPWVERVPGDGVLIGAPEDVERLLERLSARGPSRRRGPQRSSSSSSSISTSTS